MPCHIIRMCDLKITLIFVYVIIFNVLKSFQTLILFCPTPFVWCRKDQYFDFQFTHNNNRNIW